MERIVLGIVGHPGSGKDTVADYLRDTHGFIHISTGDLVREYVRHHSLGEPVRKLLQDTATKLREKYGGDYLVTEALKNPASKIAISGVRNIFEAKTIKQNGGKIIVVEAPLQFRYENAVKRGRVSEGSFEEFKAIEEKEAKNPDRNAQNVDEVIALADFTIDNSGTLESLYAKVDEIVTQMGSL